MHIERRLDEFSRIMLLEPSPERSAELGDFLQNHGYQYGGRSADNLLLLQPLLTLEQLHRVVVCSLMTPSPDMALNTFERLCGVISPAALQALFTHKKRLSQLLQVCGGSPFLVNLMFKAPEILQWIFLENGMEISRSYDDTLNALRGRLGGETEYGVLQKVLRCFKREEIVRIASRDLNGLAPLEEVTAELSSLAAASLQVAFETCRACLVREYGIPQLSTENGPRPAEMTIIGMGKLGGNELNFSSDIDIIYFYESDLGETSGIQGGGRERKSVVSLHTFFNKLAEMVNKALSQITEDGFVFRVDVGLRPEGKSGDMAVSLRSAEIYYESWGQSWERTAMLKARPVAGSLELGEQLLKMLQPFVYRKYLDYNLIEDMKQMKQKIDASLTRSREHEINLKLGRGGIREIEFLIQALQLVYAGKNPKLRERTSLTALATLRDARLISEEDARLLTDAYRFLRTTEHRIQVVQERQTHNLPTKDEEILALSRRCGFLRSNGLERFRETLEQHRRAVSAMYGTLFLSRDEKLQQDLNPETLFFLDAKADEDLVKDMLEERKFEDVERAYANLLALRQGPEKVNLTERCSRLREKIAPLLLQEVFDSPDPDMAFINLERFLAVVGARSSYFALLAENRETLKLLVSLFGMSEFLSKILIAHPELLDSMVARSHVSPLKTLEQMKNDLATELEQSDDFEDQLDLLRRYRNEEFLRIGMNDIHGRLGQTEITTQLSLVSETCLEAAFTLAVRELKRFGTPVYQQDGVEKTASMAVIGMGKMGGGDLNYHSDLDVIFVYDHHGFTNGVKQISNHEYFAKLAQKIISILTMQTREGYAYKIDTRLRPSGNAGPLVTSLESFLDYHRKEAQIWERQALTKARVVLGEAGLALQLSDVIRQTVYGASIDDDGRREIRRLRRRMENELARETADSYNIKTGRGGMVDVEFAVQYLQLRYGHANPELRSTNTIMALKFIRSLRLLPEGDVDTLLSGYKFLRKMENRLRIIHDYSVNDLSGSRQYLDKLARRLGYDPKLKNPGAALICDYEETTGKIRECFDRIFGEEEL